MSEIIVRFIILSLISGVLSGTLIKCAYGGAYKESRYGKEDKSLSLIRAIMVTIFAYLLALTFVFFMSTTFRFYEVMNFSKAAFIFLIVCGTIFGAYYFYLNQLFSKREQFYFSLEMMTSSIGIFIILPLLYVIYG